ncbi:MAG: hypothetical protein KBF56_08655 [Gemmatimonadaceae bacterium]|nr:hypothetical protein [Gemmatimonadaceae bacterium]
MRVEASEPTPVVVAPPVVVTPPVVAVAPVVVTPAAPRQPTRPLRPWGIAGMAIGGAALVTGVAAVLLQRGDAEQFNRDCERGSTDPTCTGLEQSATTWGTVTWVALPIGAAAMGAGVVMFLWPSSGRATAATEPRCAPAGAGFVCGAAF